MKEEYTDEQMYALIARYLADEASVEEVRILESWVQSSDENAKTLADARMLWAESIPSHFEPVTDIPEIDIDAAWNKVQHKIQPTSNTRVLQLRRWVSIAATLIVMFSIGYLVYDMTSTKPDQLAITTTESQTVALTDGSSIELNADSEIRYPEEFKGKKRVVELKGEAFFEIARDTTRPFVVRTGEIEIRVLGTSFNVDANAQEDSIEVQVETGLVEVGSGDDKVQLRPGETAVFYTKLGKLIKRDIKAITTQFWRNRRLNFKRAKLYEVVKALNEAYDTTILISDDQLLNRKINVKFENQEIGEILDIIANTINLKVRQDSSNNFIIEDGEN